MTGHVIGYSPDYLAAFDEVAAKVVAIYPEPLDPADRIRANAVHDLLRYPAWPTVEEAVIRRFVERCASEVEAK